MRELLSNESIIDWLRDHENDLPQTVVRELQKLDLRGQWYSEKEFREVLRDAEISEENYCNARGHIEEIDLFIDKLLDDDEAILRVKIRKRLKQEWQTLIDNTYYER